MSATPSHFQGQKELPSLAASNSFEQMTKLLHKNQFPKPLRLVYYVCLGQIGEQDMEDFVSKKKDMQKV